MPQPKRTKKNAQTRSWLQRCSYTVMREAFRIKGILFLGVRCFGREHFPQDGGVLVCANHQSNLDPPLVGMMANRRMNYLAKKTLFLHQPLKWVIEHLDAIPIDRDGMGLGGIKETIRRLRRGEMVLIFPEGQRTFDGEMTPLMPGICALARRTGVPLLPVGMDGAFQSWRRGTSVPLPTRVWMVVGAPITKDDYAGLSDAELVELLDERIRLCFDEARARRQGSYISPSEPVDLNKAQ
ncbi:MAG: lysophospholipid acyltransferase family protein [Pirellulaceae bacterium]|nr:lysophospholipid acyltransferase family protein [Pirellulaceae bacterium]